MTSEVKPPSVYARADAASRQVVLQVGLGVVAYVVGSILSVGAAARIGERLGPIDSEWGAFGFRFLFERLWLFVAVPLFGYGIGRFTEMKPSRFALVSVLSGETFSLLLVTAINGLDYVLQDTVSLIVRAVTLFLGMVMTARAVQAGRDTAAESQAEANVVAQLRKAEYAEFLAAAEGKGETASVEAKRAEPAVPAASIDQGEKALDRAASTTDPVKPESS